MISELNYKVEQEDPSLINLHVPYAEGADEERNASHDTLHDWTLEHISIYIYIYNSCRSVAALLHACVVWAPAYTEA